jgi:hypothetical protein
MENKKHLVAFLDILGFKKLIDDHFSGKNKQALPLLKKALKEAEQFGIIYSKQYLKQYNIKFSFKQFSDCVCISMPLKANYTTIEIYGVFINVIRAYQFILLDNRILIRGGISVGGHYENANIIFSDALVKSYKLESQNAIYPRILVDKELLSLIQKNLTEQPEQSNIFHQFYGKSLIKDWDDEVFISPFGMIDNLKDVEKEFGVVELKNIIDEYSAANKLGTDITFNLLSDLMEKSDIELQIINQLLAFLDKYLCENTNEKPEVLLKYKWLRQFVIWTLTPEESQIKYSQFFINKKLTTDSGLKKFEFSGLI